MQEHKLTRGLHAAGTLLTQRNHVLEYSGELSVVVGRTVGFNARVNGGGGVVDGVLVFGRVIVH